MGAGSGIIKNIKGLDGVSDKTEKDMDDRNPWGQWNPEDTRTSTLEKEMSGKAATELLEHSLTYQQNAVGSSGAIRSNTSWQNTTILYSRPTALE